MIDVRRRKNSRDSRSNIMCHIITRSTRDTGGKPGKALNISLNRLHTRRAPKLLKRKEKRFHSAFGDCGSLHQLNKDESLRDWLTVGRSVFWGQINGKFTYVRMRDGIVNIISHNNGKKEWGTVIMKYIISRYHHADT